MEEAASSHWTSTHVICLRVGQQRLFRKHIKPRTAKKSNKSDVLRVLWSMERLVIVSNIPMSKYWFPMRYGSCVVSFPLIAENSSGRPSRIRSRRWLKRNVCHRQQNTFSAATKKNPIYSIDLNSRCSFVFISHIYLQKKVFFNFCCILKRFEKWEDFHVRRRRCETSGRKLCRSEILHFDPSLLTFLFSQF